MGTEKRVVTAKRSTQAASAIDQVTRLRRPRTACGRRSLGITDQAGLATITSSSNPAPPRSSPPFQCGSLVPARARTCSNANSAAAAPPAFLIPRFSPDRPRRHENRPQESNGPAADCIRKNLRRPWSGRPFRRFDRRASFFQTATSRLVSSGLL